MGGLNNPTFHKVNNKKWVSNTKLNAQTTIKFLGHLFSGLSIFVNPITAAKNCEAESKFWNKFVV